MLTHKTKKINTTGRYCFLKLSHFSNLKNMISVHKKDFCGKKNPNLSDLNYLLQLLTT